ncbi:MAG TPA: response regulator [Caulobacteraceae bacterium]|nr:response regulator [Caulobacteraceae bacterium]
MSEAPIAPKPQTGLKVIVVEDQTAVARTLVDTLAALGHQVCGVASDVLEMAGLLQRFSADLLTIDLNLGKLHEGVGVATALQAAGPIPIVFVTGAASDEQKADIRALEAAALVIKPFTADQLRIGIALAFERARKARAGL